ncbi:RNA polymerase sigma factor [Pedobacter aquatilis]|uniref:RNA polymerase sigma factor n=1 Tax=Pedobacter aquatilis TaxID=351343 RepID=UPI00292E7CE5|nr:RNA polymerase sigma factor [Pedobacter aquatilis]
MPTLLNPIHPLQFHYLSSPLSTEEVLIEDLCMGCPIAFNNLYRNYSANLFGVILKIVNQHETAEDLLQDVFLKIRRSIAFYDSDRGRFFTWMLNIARNTAIDHLRLRSSRNERSHVIYEEVVAELDHHIHFFNTDTIGLKKLVANLNARQQQILELCYFKGYTHTEISEALDMPLGSVKTAIRMAILELRKAFDAD